MSDSHLLNTNNIVNLDTYLASNYVTTDTNQNITGVKTFTSPITVTQSQDVAYLSHFKNTSIASNNVTPSSLTIETIQFEANDSSRVGHLRGIQQTNGTYSMDMLVNSSVSGSSKTASIAVGLNSAGDAYTQAPAPTDTTSTSSVQIATVGWSNTNLSRIDLTNSPYTTNRILEIPQDIKLELNNGTLTLKAGSKVYVPNGFEQGGTTPKFDVVTTTRDFSTVYGTANTSTILLTMNASVTSMEEGSIGVMYSGATAPTVSGSNFALWYDTTNNLIKGHISDSTWGSGGHSLPFAIVHRTINIGYDSIDQVFNGSGFIGTTAFVLPGVKLEYTLGRNSDGTYKNYTYTTPSVYTTTISSTQTRPSYNCLQPTTGVPIGTPWFFEIRNTIPTNMTSGMAVFCLEDGYFYWSSNGTTIQKLTYPIIPVSYSYISSGKITKFTSYNVNTVNSYSRPELSGIGMPSSNYINLTLGASNSTYTAPANGWVRLDMIYNTTDQYTRLAGKMISQDARADGTQYAFIPVLKGDSFIVSYNGTLSNPIFRFYYAEGEI